MIHNWLNAVRVSGVAADETMATLLDLFTGSNGDTLPAHAPNEAPAGAEWSVEYGTWDIQSNAARAISVDGTKKYATVLIESGKADGQIAVVNRRGASGGDYNGGGIVFRATDKLNFLIATFIDAGLYVIRIQNGTLGVVATTPITLNPSVDYIIEVVFLGQDITVLMDGGRATLATTSTFNQTATRVGLHEWRPGSTFDLFEVV
jgi:hypothetical protein